MVTVKTSESHNQLVSSSDSLGDSVRMGTVLSSHRMRVTEASKDYLGNAGAIDEGKRR